MGLSLRVSTIGAAITAAMAMTVSSTGNAAVAVNFDNLDGSGGIIDLQTDTIIQNGIRISTTQGTNLAIVASDFANSDGDASLFADVQNPGDGWVFESSTPGESISLRGISAESIFNLAGGVTTDQQLVFQGHNIFGNVITDSSMQIDSVFGEEDFIVSGPLSTQEFEKIVLLQGQGLNAFHIDNLHFDTAVIPEPGTMALIGLGSFFLMKRRAFSGIRRERT